MCPYCKSHEKLKNKGFYLRKSDQKKLRRFKCPSCLISFSETIFDIDYRLRKRHINQATFKSLCSGISQRRCAYLLGIKPIGIARRVLRFGACARHNLEVYRISRAKAASIQFDEMESFEHSKCKPLTMPIAVESGTRKILSLRVGKISAKGNLAAISRKRYGRRFCERKRCIEEVFKEVAQCFDPNGIIKSDESAHYPRAIKRHFPLAKHLAFKGKRGCVVGQGELKGGGFDPLFSLNHSYAMFRDNLKRLSRRTWCTTKRPDCLEALMFLYAWYHNLWLERKKIPVHLSWALITS